MSRASRPRRVLITGAGRGLGLEFARQWLAGGHEVFALSRDPRSSKGLAGLAKAHPATLHTHACEVTSDASVNEARRAVEAAWDRLDILVNNAAVYGGESHDPAGFAFTLSGVAIAEAEHGAGDVHPEVARDAGSHLRGVEVPAVCIRNQGGPHFEVGGRYAYRVSKAALNMVSRNLAHDFKKDGILSVALHPGWVRTDMGGPDAPLGPEEAVASLIRTIAALETAHNGGFYDREGRPQPW